MHGEHVTWFAKAKVHYAEGGTEPNGDGRKLAESQRVQEAREIMHIVDPVRHLRSVGAWSLRRKKECSFFPRTAGCTAGRFAGIMNLKRPNGSKM